MFTKIATKITGTVAAILVIAGLAISVSLVSSNSVASSSYMDAYNDPIYVEFLQKGYDRRQAEILTLFFKTYKAANGEYPDTESLEFVASNLETQFPFTANIDKDKKLAFLTLVYEYGSSIYVEIPNFVESYEKGDKLAAQSSLRTSNYCVQNYGICSAVDAALFQEQN